VSLEPTVEGVVSEAGGDAVGLMGGGEVDDFTPDPVVGLGGAMVEDVTRAVEDNVDVLSWFVASEVGGDLAGEVGGEVGSDVGGEVGVNVAGELGGGVAGVFGGDMSRVEVEDGFENEDDSFGCPW